MSTRTMSKRNMCATGSSTSPVVTRGDEKSSPWNPLPCVCKGIPPQKRYTYTHARAHTPTLCLHVDQPPAAWSSLPFSPPEGRGKAGQRAQSPLLNGSLGLSWNVPVVLRMDGSHTPLLIHCWGERRGGEALGSTDRMSGFSFFPLSANCGRVFLK